MIAWSTSGIFRSPISSVRSCIERQDCYWSIWSICCKLGSVTEHFCNIKVFTGVCIRSSGKKKPKASWKFIPEKVIWLTPTNLEIKSNQMPLRGNLRAPVLLTRILSLRTDVFNTAGSKSYSLISSSIFFLGSDNRLTMLKLSETKV